MKVCYLTGGVGGARLLHGLARVLSPSALTAIVNVGDDFDHFGLRICPDLDTVLYTLSGLGDRRRGWGLQGESFRALEMVRRYGGEDWFQLGDKDLGTHLVRAAWLGQGQTLTQVTARLSQALGVGCAVLPMSDEPLQTWIETADGEALGFQHWLVRRSGEPRVTRVLFRGQAWATEAVLQALDSASLVVIGPSNPYVSIDPILSLPGVRERVAKKTVIAVSPIVAGQAIKGPLAAMIPALSGHPASAAAIAEHYGELLSGIAVERGDDAGLRRVAVLATRTVMRSLRDRRALAAELLSFAEGLQR